MSEERRGRGKALMKQGLLKEETVRARLTPKQKEAFVAIAVTKGMTSSEFLRYLIIKAIEEYS